MQWWRRPSAWFTAALAVVFIAQPMFGTAGVPISALALGLTVLLVWEERANHRWPGQLIVVAIVLGGYMAWVDVAFFRRGRYDLLLLVPGLIGAGLLLSLNRWSRRQRPAEHNPRQSE